MVKEEADFPRGGKKQVESTSKDDKNPGVKLRQLKRKEELKSRKRQNAEESPFEKPAKKFRRKDDVHVESPLPNDALCLNMVVLACVKNVHPHSITVSLPGNLTATVPITDISEAYSRQLQQLSQGDDADQTDVIASATEFLKPGFFIPVALKSISDDKRNTGTSITGSFRPADIAVGLFKSDVQDGMLLMGNVSSVEDHGYTIDTGIRGLKAFLKNADAQGYIDKCCPGNQLNIGQPLWCIMRMKGNKSVDKNDNRVVNVMVDPDVIEKAKMPKKVQMNMLLPGTKVTAHVKAVGDQGLVVTFGTFEGFLHVSHLTSYLSSYSVSEAIDAVVLYVHPETKVIHLSALSEIVTQNGTAVDMFSGMGIGDFVQASIQRLIPKKGIYFKLPGNKKGFAALSQLTDGKDVPDLNNYRMNQSFKGRVMGFNHMEGLILVTLKISILEQQIITVDSLKPGDVVEATILDVLPKGAFVMLSSGIYSFIPNMHMTNKPIEQLSKKFESGMQLKCRVMQVDVEKKRVYLTHKSALVKTKALIPTEYANLSRGIKVTGVIIVLKDTFFIVRFFNNVNGIVPLSEMGLEKGKGPLDQFHLGQVVSCQVVNVLPDQEKLKLSFISGSKVEHKRQEEIHEPLDLTAGLVTGAKIVGEGEDFYKLVLTPSNHPAVLPFTHLSDYPDVQNLRKLTFKVGHVLSKVTYFNKKQTCTVSMKESLIKAAENKLFVSTFSDLEVGMLLPGVIKTHQDCGFFVELAGGFTGLCPARTIVSVDPSALKDLYPVGKSVFICVVDLDKKKERFLVGISKQDCVQHSEEDPVSFFQEYLESRQIALKELIDHDENLKPYGDVKIGSCIYVTVTSVHKKGVLCELPSGLKAIATQDHLGDAAPVPGKQYPAVVLDLDVSSPCLEVTFDPIFCKTVETCVKYSICQVKTCHTIESELVLIKDGFMLMKLKEYGSGHIVYVPVRKHFNDVFVPSTYKIGMCSYVVIKGKANGYFIGFLKGEHKLSKTESDKTEVQEEKVQDISPHEVLVGNVVEAKVKAVHPFQMNIVSNGIHGRVHVTEVTDDAVGKNPLHKYKKRDKLKVKVIGVRSIKTQGQSSLPISRPIVSRTLLECSLKESKMTATDPKVLTNLRMSTFIGSEMTVYVVKVDAMKLLVEGSLIHQGFISYFHTSEYVEVINNPAKHFKVGQPLRATIIKKPSNDNIQFSLIGPEVIPKIGKEVTARITGGKQSEYLSVQLYDGFQGKMEWHPKASVSIGKYVRCMVKSLSRTKGCRLCVAGSRKRKISSTQPGSDQENQETEKINEGEHGDGQVVKKKPKKTLADNGEKDSHKLSKATKNRLTVDGFTWGGDLNVKLKAQQEVSDDDDDDDEDDDVGNAVADKKARKKRNKEKFIEEYEKQQLKGKSVPQSVNDFERLVLQSPNSSMVWLGFMAYHLELGEVAKAKAVAEKALNTIVFREEQEKKNVWLAYLNLETMYGESGDLKKLLQRAVTYNDPLDINLKMCDIYVGANKIEEAEQQYNLLIKKFKKEKTVWKSYAQFLYKQDRLDSARNILKHSFAALDKRDHVEVISRFANLEFSHGNPERGRTMYENLIASYPGRTDIWSVYVDMVVKSGDIAGARQLMERAVKQKVNTKKLTFLIQKFIKFEETHGTEDQVQKVKDMAVSLFDTE